MLKNARAEKLAQSFVKNCGDVTLSYREAYPEIAEGKTPAKIKKLFDTAYAKDAAFWRRVAELQKPVEQQIALNALGVLNELSLIATADATKLSSVVTTYAACVAGCDDDKPVRASLAPVCESCGLVRPPTKSVHIPDTADLSPHDRKLFKAAEQTKYGIKVHLRDQDAALLNLAKIHGMFVERLKLIDNDEPEMPPLPDDPNEAARIYNEWVKGT